MKKSDLNNGAALMLIASLAFIGYAVLFFFRNFTGGGFELGVTTLNGVTPDNLNALNPAIMHYIMHLHIATAGLSVSKLAGVIPFSVVTPSSKPPPAKLRKKNTTA